MALGYTSSCFYLVSWGRAISFFINFTRHQGGKRPNFRALRNCNPARFMRNFAGLAHRRANQSGVLGQAGTARAAFLRRLRALLFGIANRAVAVLSDISSRSVREFEYHGKLTWGGTVHATRQLPSRPKGYSKGGPWKYPRGG